jgi:hypothetical protein
MLFIGPIPDGICVLHRCDVKPCFNPDHLFLGTKGENNADTTAKGRHHNTVKKVCKRGHNDWGISQRKDRINRWCRVCDRERKR